MVFLEAKPGIVRVCMYDMCALQKVATHLDGMPLMRDVLYCMYVSMNVCMRSPRIFA
jgi:hypothetical protein